MEVERAVPRHALIGTTLRQVGLTLTVATAIKYRHSARANRWNTACLHGCLLPCVGRLEHRRHNR